ncbi:hypothetical protein ACH5RR_017987 [Cinchona calisaya]|uniref:Uncharacterized protein n=1 Tax=Cinchona calisaya TaxID=153742 RepID=A0ABD2ZKI3_9GENT
MQEKEFYKYHGSWSHSTINYLVFGNLVQSTIEKGLFQFGEEKNEATEVEKNPFPTVMGVNMVNIEMPSSNKVGSIQEHKDDSKHVRTITQRCSDEHRCDHCCSRLEQVLISISKVNKCDNDVIVSNGDGTGETESVTLVIDSKPQT